MALFRCGSGGSAQPTIGTISVSVNGSSVLTDSNTGATYPVGNYSGSGGLDPSQSTSSSFNVGGTNNFTAHAVNKITNSGSGTITYNPATRSVEINIVGDESVVPNYGES